ncbi:Extracellular matrix glycoprotein Laminin subunits alpha and gamma, partial [Trachipleistophora hominis]
VMTLSTAIKSLDNMNALLAKVPKIEKIDAPSKTLMPTMLAEQRKKELLEQLIPFTHKVIQNIEEYITAQPKTYQDIEKKYERTKYMYDSYKSTVEDTDLNGNYEKAVSIKNDINKLNDYIKESSETITFNYENSVKLFDTVEEGIYMDNELCDFINNKFRFEIEGVDDREIEVLEEMLSMLEK